MGVTQKKYERLGSCGIDLCVVALRDALGMLGYTPPVLRVHSEGLVTAWRIASVVPGGIAVEVDQDIKDWDEWYIEWNGRRVGSEGA